ncbi:MAG: TIGR03905 family TSCPD domain-containing protein [Clostridia bacterium]|nr:TIGR03905 family TSCPD domain-containing protein [Clostridia bacterium]
MRYNLNGVCARYVDIEVDGDVIKKVTFLGGCSGNTQGVARLVEGQKIDDVIDKLSGIRCGFKNTSCPDQLTRVLRKVKDEQNS